jgi:hypothetical protein
MLKDGHEDQPHEEPEQSGAAKDAAEPSDGGER